MDIYKSADSVAREFLSGIYRNVKEFDVTVARNAILDCLFSSEEPDFIAVVCANRLLRRDARRVIGKMAPHLVDLCGRTLEESRA